MGPKTRPRGRDSALLLNAMAVLKLLLRCLNPPREDDDETTFPPKTRHDEAETDPVSRAWRRILPCRIGALTSWPTAAAGAPVIPMRQDTERGVGRCDAKEWIKFGSPSPLILFCNLLWVVIKKIHVSYLLFHQRDIKNLLARMCVMI